MADISSIIKFAVWLGKALGSTASRFDQFNAEDVGIVLPDSFLERIDVKNAVSAVKSAAQSLNKASNDLGAAGLAGNEVEIVLKFTLFANGIRLFLQAMVTMEQTVQNAATAANFPDPAERSAVVALAGNGKKFLLDYLIITTVEFINPQILFLLKLLGLIDWGHTSAEATHSLSTGYVKKTLHLNRFEDLISDPLDHFKNTIGWGSNAFDPSDFFDLFSEFLDPEDYFESGTKNGEPYLKYEYVTLQRDSTTSPSALKVELDADITKSTETRRVLNKYQGITTSTTMSFDGGASMVIEPPFSISLEPLQGEAKGLFKLFINRNEFARPFDILKGGIINLQADDYKLGVGLEAKWDVNKGEASINPLFFADLSKATITIGAEEGDSFVSKLLSNTKIKGGFSLGIEWTGDDGLKIKASGGMEIALPIHKEIGPIKITTIYIILTIKQNGEFQLEVSSGFSAKLGPLTATVERLGALAKLKFSDQNTGDLGLFDFGLGFSPPKGVGLAIDASVVKGGGYLYFDFEKGEYAGAIELVFAEFLALKAVGIITTKLPDGSKGFSLLVIITAEFGTPIQLGYGFTLSGVGGLLGLNRTVRMDLLGEGVKTGAVSSIMFPKNVVENASRIISDLKKYFPQKQKVFLIGPMAKLGWGTPNLVTLSLGIILQLPGGNIAILGVLKVALPHETAPLLVLQVNFAGALEWDKKRGWFYAQLYESRILYMTLEGGMGVLVAWGDNANFLLSVGGFHPSFDPPPLPFPSPPRVSINILNAALARIRVMAYFAVTSNTVQFGARAELFFGLSAFKIEGHIGFDALFRFSPFYFIISISASLSVKVFGIGLFNVRMRGTLDGPTPWHIEGTGSIGLLFWDIDVDFSHTWGQKKDTTLPSINVMPLLKAEFEKMENWEASIPKANRLSVSLRKIDSAADLVLHPVGTLKASQRFAPLNVTLDKVGSQKPKDYNFFTLTVDDAGGELEVKRQAKEMFAMAQFKNMSDAKKLSAPAYEKKAGGVEISVKGEQMLTSGAVKRVVRYEQIIIDNNYKRFVVRFFNFVSGLFKFFLKGNAVSLSSISNKYMKQKMPFEEKITLIPETYAVAFNTDNTPLNKDSKAFTSYTEAEEYMNRMVNINPNLQDGIHVIPQVEMEKEGAA
jgi:hypothetical protein